MRGAAVMFLAIGARAFFSHPMRFSAGRVARSDGRLAASTLAEPTVAPGDLVTVDWKITVDGKPLPESTQVFDEGTVKFVVGEGGFLPCLHSAVQSLQVGERKTVHVEPEHAYGPSDPNRGPVEVPASAAPPGLQVGDQVRLVTGATARVTAMNGESITIDANHEMAGKALDMEVELKDCVKDATAVLEKADFAIGCFWGAELAFQREPGVYATKVGYTQGEVTDPTYQQVCSGTTGHTEGVQVLFDPKEVTFERLLDLFWDRLGDNRYLLNQVGNDRGTQYRHGIYTHSEEQLTLAQASARALPRAVEIRTEIMPATTFYDAEDYHQQYLQKGGQSAKKQAEETIRCYG